MQIVFGNFKHERVLVLFKDVRHFSAVTIRHGHLIAQVERVFAEIETIIDRRYFLH